MSKIRINPAKARAIRSVDVKRECERRILEVMPIHKQNTTQAAALDAMMKHGTDPAKWPKKLQERQNSAMAAWTEINRLRERSNEIEAMEPIPADLSDDALWV
jgi:hypothetical protein